MQSMVLFRDDMAWINAFRYYREHCLKCSPVVSCSVLLSIGLIGFGAWRCFLPHIFERTLGLLSSSAAWLYLLILCQTAYHPQTKIF